MFFQPPRFRFICTVFLPFLLVVLVVAFFLAVFPVFAAAQEIVHFTDRGLEAAVRQTLDRPTGLLTGGDLARLRTLEAVRQDISNLSGLEYARNLESLNLYQNKVEDLAALEGLTRLKVLNLGNNHIGDISSLQRLAALEELDLSYNHIKNIDALKNLTRLRCLHLEGNEIGTLTPLVSLKALESLFLSNLNDKNIEPLAKLTRLKDLMLANGNISDISFLAKFKQLQRLELYNNRISELEPLRGLSRLEWLSLPDNKIEDIDILGGLRQLKHLDLHNNRVREITSLLKLRNIQWVELQNNFLELAEGTPARRDLDELLSAGVEVISSPQRLPFYSGNGLVSADAGSGGQLLRTPAERYFTLLNYTTGWRIKGFTVSHEGGKPLDYVRDVGYRLPPPGIFCWYSTSGNNCVGAANEDKKDNDKNKAFYTLTYEQPGPIQLGLAVQIWPGYADDSSRDFYISQVELENVETGDLYTVELDRDAPLPEKASLSGSGNFSPDYQAKTVSGRAALARILAEAQEQRVSSLEIRYSGEALQMPGDVEEMLEENFAEDDYLRYSQRSYNIRWSSEPGGNMLLDLHFQYMATREEENFVERKVADILRQILDPGMDDRQKTRAIHDYIVANVAYDLNYRDHSAYAALAKGRAVCQGYALLLYKMLDEAGVGVRIVSGEAGGEKHLWNMVNLDGSWYHIDATWNDPVPDVPGRVRHDYYLKTDAEMAATHTRFGYIPLVPNVEMAATHTRFGYIPLVPNVEMAVTHTRDL
ncbi:MAG: hypothetical protein GX996_05560 [Firmicutes bacterium]|nr:hypothetical protein [Bacillota bacterium]